MKQKETESNAKLIVVLVVSILILVALVVAGTYSFYTVTVLSNNTANNKLTVNTSKIVFEIVDGTLTGDNLIPGDTITKTFQVKNTGTTDINFKLMWKNVVNNFVNKKDLIVTLTEDGTSIISSADNVTLPSTVASAVLKDNLTIASGATKSYVLTITYENTDEDQTADMGKNISAEIELVG